MEFPINFLNATIVRNGDGIVISKNGCNALPGAMVFSKEPSKEEQSVVSAKRDIIRLFMIEHSDTYEASIYYRMNKRGGAYLEWFTMKNHLQSLGMDMPEGLGPSGDMNMLISFEGKVI